MTSRDVARRYLALQALRWLPTGLIIPVVVLLLQQRGLTLAQIGIAGAAQGVLVLLLELPTGGLADSLGRRPTLLLATAVDVLSLTALALVHSMALAVLAFALQGVYRALESGPLDAWFVDATLLVDPDAHYERTLARGSATLSIAIAAGALSAAGLVALAPHLGVEPLLLPILVAIAGRVLNLVAVHALMTEVRAAVGMAAIRDSIRQVPGLVAEAIRTVRASHVLVALVAVEVFWGFSMTTFEFLLPPRLAEVVGDPEQAAAIVGPAVTVAWVVSAAGSAAVPRASARFGPQRTAAALRLLQGLAIAGMGIFASAGGVLLAYVINYLFHGAANPVHMGLLHRQVSSEHRTTVLSVNSMVSHPAGAVGGIVLGAIASGPGLASAMIVGGVVAAVAAPLYLVGSRRT